MRTIMDDAGEAIDQGMSLSGRLETVEWKVQRLEDVVRRVVQHLSGKALFSVTLGELDAAPVAAPVSIPTPAQVLPLAVAAPSPTSHQPATPSPATPTAPSSGGGPIESSTSSPAPIEFTTPSSAAAPMDTDPAPLNLSPSTNNAPSFDPPVVQLQPPTPQASQEGLAESARIIHPNPIHEVRPRTGQAVAGPSRLAPPARPVTRSRSKSPTPSGSGTKRKADDKDAAESPDGKRLKSG